MTKQKLQQWRSADWMRTQGSSPLTDEQYDSLIREINAWMKTQTARIQKIVILRYWYDKSWKDVAERMGGRCTEYSVRKELERVLEKD